MFITSSSPLLLMAWRCRFVSLWVPTIWNCFLCSVICRGCREQSCVAGLRLGKPAGIAMAALTIRKECYYCCLWRSNPSETANIFSLSTNDHLHEHGARNTYLTRCKGGQGLWEKLQQTATTDSPGERRGEKSKPRKGLFPPLLID